MGVKYFINIMVYFRRRVYAPRMMRSRRGFDPRAKTVKRFANVNKRSAKGVSLRGGVRNQIRTIARAVRELKPELKYLDVDTDFTNVTTGGAISHISSIPVGDDNVTRNGDTVNVKSILLQYAIRGFSAGDAYRMAIVCDKQTVSDTAPAVSDIFSVADPIGAMPNLNTLERFQFLYLSPIIDGRMLEQGGSPSLREFQWRGNLKLSFNGDAGTDFQKNAIFIVFLSDQAGATVDVEATTRIAFTDV